MAGKLCRTFSSATGQCDLTQRLVKLLSVEDKTLFHNGLSDGLQLITTKDHRFYN